VQKGGTGGAIVVGVLVFAPTAQHLGGLQTIATAEHRVAAAILWVLLPAFVNVALVWLFLAAHLANQTGRNGIWIRRARGWTR